MNWESLRFLCTGFVISWTPPISSQPMSFIEIIPHAFHWNHTTNFRKKKYQLQWFFIFFLFLFMIIFLDTKQGIDVNAFLLCEGHDKWEVCERETQSLNQFRQAQNVNGLFWSSTSSCIDHFSPRGGHTWEAFSLQAIHLGWIQGNYILSTARRQSSEPFQSLPGQGSSRVMNKMHGQAISNAKFCL